MTKHFSKLATLILGASLATTAATAGGELQKVTALHQIFEHRRPREMSFQCLWLHLQLQNDAFQCYE